MSITWWTVSWRRSCWLYYRWCGEIFRTEIAIKTITICFIPKTRDSRVDNSWQSVSNYIRRTRHRNTIHSDTPSLLVNIWINKFSFRSESCQSCELSRSPIRPFIKSSLRHTVQSYPIVFIVIDEEIIIGGIQNENSSRE